MPSHTSHAPGTLCWFDLMTDDVAAARAFYSAVFHWTYTVGTQDEGFYSLARGCDQVVAGLGGTPPDRDLAPGWTVYFAATDVEAASASVTALGGQVLAGPLRVMDHGRVIIAEDPAGARFGLWQAARQAGAELTDAHGAMTWAELNTRDLPVAVAYYSDLLGLEPSDMAFPGSRYSMLTHEGGPVAGVLEMNEQWPDDMPSHWMPYFAVADADAAAAAVRSAGGQVGHGPFDTAYGRIVVAIDPQGAVFSCVQLARKAGL